MTRKLLCVGVLMLLFIAGCSQPSQIQVLSEQLCPGGVEELREGDDRGQGGAGILCLGRGDKHGLLFAYATEGDLKVGAQAFCRSNSAAGSIMMAATWFAWGPLDEEQRAAMYNQGATDTDCSPLRAR